jgi:hypothetical protein
MPMTSPTTIRLNVQLSGDFDRWCCGNEPDAITGLGDAETTEDGWRETLDIEADTVEIAEAEVRAAAAASGCDVISVEHIEVLSGGEPNQQGWALRVIAPATDRAALVLFYGADIEIGVAIDDDDLTADSVCPGQGLSLGEIRRAIIDCVPACAQWDWASQWYD